MEPKQDGLLTLGRVLEPATDGAILESESRINPMTPSEREWTSDNANISEYLRSQVGPSFPA